jgi:two-component system chemotaxis response regulator CheY
MAILIVDDESQTREALRNLLTVLRYPVVLDAKNGEEALRVIEAESSRIRMILSDLEMPYMDGRTLSEKIAEDSKFDLIPFLLITSDLTLAQLAKNQKSPSRIDRFLIKPFRITQLSKHMNEAFVHRKKMRNQLLYIGTEEPSGLIEVLESPVGGIWKKLCLVKTPSELESLLRSENLRRIIKLGGLIIDPSAFNDSTRGEWSEILHGFKKTPLGSTIPFACLSRNPREVFHFRTHAQYFCPKGTRFQDWQSLLLQMEARALSSWEIDLLLQEVRQWNQKQDYTKACKIVEKILKLDPASVEAYSMLADLQEQLSNPSQVISAHQQSIEINPTLPRPYLKLLMNPQRFDQEVLIKIADDAILYCPHHLEVLIAASRCFIQAGLTAKAQRILQTASKLEPSHSEVTKLLTTLSSQDSDPRMHSSQASKDS